jgi:hypothetical protein
MVHCRLSIMWGTQTLPASGIIQRKAIERVSGVGAEESPEATPEPYDITHCHKDIGTAVCHKECHNAATNNVSSRCYGC